MIYTTTVSIVYTRRYGYSTKSGYIWFTQHGYNIPNTYVRYGIHTRADARGTNAASARARAQPVFTVSLLLSVPSPLVAFHPPQKKRP